jgi:hypothetical protein
VNSILVSRDEGRFFLAVSGGSPFNLSRIMMYDIGALAANTISPKNAVLIDGGGHNSPFVWALLSTNSFAVVVVFDTRDTSKDIEFDSQIGATQTYPCNPFGAKPQCASGTCNLVVVFQPSQKIVALESECDK